MACIKHLHINHFRHFNDFSIQPEPGINLITGLNGSGKTSILESIYCLAYGKSFRASRLDSVITRGAGQLNVFAEVTDQSDALAKMGIQKKKAQQLAYRINNDSVDSIAGLARMLPIMLLTTQSSRYFTDGPKIRRDFLSWGAFYAYSDFHMTWKHYQRALSQRNTCLRNQASEVDLNIWGDLLGELGQQLHQYYLSYVNKLQPLVYRYMNHFMPGIDVRMKYHPGWDVRSNDLAIVLRDTIMRSSELGYTHLGIHRCDLQFYSDGVVLQNVFSRGQLKLAHCALALAQGAVLADCVSQKPIYLIDDLAAELDTKKQSLVYDELIKLGSQVFIAAIDADIALNHCQADGKPSITNLDRVAVSGSAVT